MKIHLVTGFLGSGKTTAIFHAINSLVKEQVPVAVITNDQGSRLVDGNLFESIRIPGKQVKGGCFCCNYNELAANIQTLANTEGSSVIFAEAAGSCTDIIATVLKPLHQFYPHTAITISTFTDIRLLRMMLYGNHSFDPSIEYIYHKQLEEAEIVVVNKADLVNEAFKNDIKIILSERFPGKQVIFQNSLQTADIRQWLSVLDNFHRQSLPASLDIDYDVYAAGEASMAWYDQQLEIYTEKNDAGEITEELVNSIYSEIVRSDGRIGHIKFLVDGSLKISFTGKNEQPVKLPLHRASKTEVLINIRVQGSPGWIEQLMAAVLARFEQKCTIISTNADTFNPGYPTPIHRM